MDIYDVEPKSTPDIFAERPVLVFGKYKGKPSGKIKVKGISGKSPYEMSLNLSDYKASNENEALRYLWARQRIAILGDYNNCLLYTSPSPRDATLSRMPSSA